MFKATLIIAALLVVFLFVKCTSNHNYPKQHLQFYDNRYYPIPELSEMPSSNLNKLILYGTHYSTKGDTSKAA